MNDTNKSLQIINAEVDCIDNTINATVGEVNIIKGLDGKDGKDGVSPTITVAENTDTVYKLEITDVNGSFTTPNLKGEKGEGGSATVDLKAGSNIEISEDNVISVLTTNDVEHDNTRPITSAGVSTIVGNIDILLQTI